MRASIAMFAMFAVGGALTGCAHDQYADAVLDDHPLAYWQLDDGAGARFASDDSGNGNDAVVVGPVMFESDGAFARAGTSATFADQMWLSAGDQFGFDSGGDFTLELWVNPSIIDGCHRPFLAKGDFIGFTGGYMLELQASTADPTQTFASFDSLSTGTGAAVPFAANTWTFLDVTMSATTLSYYLNGTLAAQGEVSPWAASTEPFTISAPSDAPHGGGCFEGQLDEVAVYGSALVADRIAAHYAASE